MFVQDSLPPLLLDGIRNGLGKQAGLFDQSDEGQVNELQWVHKSVSLVPWSAWLQRGCGGMAGEFHECLVFRFDCLVAASRSLLIFFLR
jgi:hypothetical protein